MIIRSFFYVLFVIISDLVYSGDIAVYHGVSILNPRDSIDAKSGKMFYQTPSEQYQVIFAKIEDIYLQGEWKKRQDNGEKFITLKDFSDTDWPRIKRTLDDEQSALEIYKELLTSFTQCKIMDVGLTSEAYFDQIPLDIRKKAKLKNIENWQSRLRDFPTSDDVVRVVSRIPQNADEGFIAYGEKYDFRNFCKQWTLEELKKIKPEYAERFTTAGLERFLTTNVRLIQTKNGPRQVRLRGPIEPYIRATRNLGLAAAQQHIIINRELGNVNFHDKDSEKDITEFWNGIKVADSVKDLLPWDEIR